jgi:hypothetical protein
MKYFCLHLFLIFIVYYISKNTDYNCSSRGAYCWLPLERIISIIAKREKTYQPRPSVIKIG